MKTVVVHHDLKVLLDHSKEAVANKWDGVALIDGLEGSGKSGLGMLSCYYVDRTFNIDRIVFTPEQFEEAVEKASVGQAILWDEFVTAGMSTDFMTEIQRTLVMKMTMIRKKRLFIFWVMPYYFLVARYFAVARSRYLLHSYTPDGISRGTFKTWNYERKKKMYFRGRKEFDYCEEPYGKGTFPDFFTTYPGVIDEEAYELKKDEATNSTFEQETNPRMKKIMDAFKKICTFVFDKGLLNQSEIARLTGYSRTWINNIIGEEKYERKQED
jgi:hypothetical protein